VISNLPVRGAALAAPLFTGRCCQSGVIDFDNSSWPGRTIDHLVDVGDDISFVFTQMCVWYDIYAEL
jgi:hypothetical protein